MKESLELKIGQHLSMTPQLQQAIRLLQLSSLDLQQEVQEALDSNPLLDTPEDESRSEKSTQSLDDKEREQIQTINTDDGESSSVEASSKSTEAELAATDDTAEQWNNDIPVELATDSNWDDTFQHGPSSSNSHSDPNTMESNDTTEESLQDHLNWQLNLTPMSTIDQLIAENIIDGIDNDGYLRTELDEILQQFQNSNNLVLQEIEMDEIEVVLRRIQQFEPAGIAARNLSECLTIQLLQLPEDTEHLHNASKIVNQYIQLLGSHDYKTLMRKMRLSEKQLQQSITLILTLNPQPGASITPNAAQYITPDVFVEKIEGFWQVRLNGDNKVNLKINNTYADMIKRADNSDDNNYLKNHLQEARWLIKSIQSRYDTLLKVSQQILERQLDFFEFGEMAMKPMVLQDIAEAVDMHESTISRATTQKYMHTPNGIFELKYFFSSHVSTSDGGAASSTAIRAQIKQILTTENPIKPLSDNKIAKLLKDEGINVARRTIAKYRESMGIAPSNERKRLL
ncbi:MAG: RNA polymerase factor sigma-54 [Pseudomonadales bacterium]|nr:RNA polymerase factor sigma-54 [Pseudomonadales bacterium]